MQRTYMIKMVRSCMIVYYMSLTFSSAGDRL
jgi:hypothetical protein